MNHVEFTKTSTRLTSFQIVIISSRICKHEKVYRMKAEFFQNQMMRFGGTNCPIIFAIRI